MTVRTASPFELYGGTGGVSRVDIEQFQEELDKQVNALPEAFFRELNGGVNLSEQAKLSPRAKHQDLFILGEYSVSPSMGRYITIYYGSFQRVFPMDTDSSAAAEIRKVLRHEFRHHLESLAMVRYLELEDARQLDEYCRHDAEPTEPAVRRGAVSRHCPDTEPAPKEPVLHSPYSPRCTSTVIKTSAHRLHDQGAAKDPNAGGGCA